MNNAIAQPAHCHHWCNIANVTAQIASKRIPAIAAIKIATKKTPTGKNITLLHSNAQSTLIDGILCFGTVMRESFLLHRTGFTEPHAEIVFKMPHVLILPACDHRARIFKTHRAAWG